MSGQFKQGLYSPVNKSKYIGKHQPRYLSSWELKFFQWCDRNTNVLEWASEAVIVPYTSPVDGRVHRYMVDNIVAIKEGDNIVKYLIEIKPSKQTKPPEPSKRKKKTTIIYENLTYAVNCAKWEAAKKWCLNKNWKFLILTENELFSS